MKSTRAGSVSLGSLNARKPREFDLLEDRTLLQGDPILFWNDVAMDTALADTRQFGENPGPTYMTRAMAIVHVAMFDAFTGTRVLSRFTPYHVTERAQLDASRPAAIAQAAHDTLASLFPAQTAALDAILAEELTAIGASPRSQRRGTRYGALVADRVLEPRQADGSDNAVNRMGIYSPGNTTDASGRVTAGDAGFHNTDPLNAQGFLTPGWGSVEPFAISNLLDFLPPAFPDMGDATSPAAVDLPSDSYAATYNEVRCLGAVDSELVPNPHPNCESFGSRTDDETELGLFWGYDHRLGTPMRIYNDAVRVVAVQQANSVGRNARLFALVHIALADAGIAAWGAKYMYDVWRPVLAIRNGEIDGNPNTAGEPNWVPLGAPANFGDIAGDAGNAGPDADPDPAGGPDFTPPFPAYISGHATFGAATFRTLANFYGRDDIAFDLFSEDSGTTRHFDTFTEANVENGRSRIFLGIHWAQDDLLGRAVGASVADFVFQNVLRPVRTST